MRDRNDIERLREYLRKKEKHGVMYSLMLTCGCNLGLRASDLRQLTVGHLRDKTHLEIVEIKTGKERKIIINEKLRKEFDEYVSRYLYVADEKKLFGAQGSAMAIDVKHMHKVIKRSCRVLGIKGNFGSHTMRKTFAYHLYSLKPNVTYIKDVLRHSDEKVTRIYVGGNEAVKISRKQAYPEAVCGECTEEECLTCPLQDEVIGKLNL